MIIHKNFMTSQRNMNPYNGYLKHEQKHSNRIFVRSKADQVEISEEAHKIFDRKQVVELEKARNKKIAGEYLPEVREILGNDGDLRNVIRLEKITLVRNKISMGMLLGDSEDIIEKTADAVSAFL